MLECPKCGYNNELGRIFCHSCGTKLDLSQIKPPSEGAKMRRRIQRSVGRTIRILVETAIAGALIFSIFLMCGVPEVKPVKATNAELLAANTRRMDLESLVNGRRAGKVIVSETDLNAYLNSLTFDNPGGSGIQVTPAALRATLNDGVLKLEFVGTMHFGQSIKKDLYIGYEGEPVIANGKLMFRPTGGWIGKLPFHPKLVMALPIFDKYFGTLLGKLDEEKQLLDKLSRIQVAGESAELIKETAAAP
jgi:hypothetical protein